jgi:dihydropteroate synthase
MAKPAAAPKSAAGSLAGFYPTVEPGARVYLRPVGLLPREAWATGAAVPLAGGAFSFAQAQLIVRRPRGAGILRAYAPLSEIMAWGYERGAEIAGRLDKLLGALTRARPPFAGVSLDRPRIMGVVNVTPDSFSDGGRFLETEAAVRHGRALAAAGAEILDVGGESTRPGAVEVDDEEEIARVVPVIRALAADGLCVSVDTRHGAVMRAATDAGAAIINDISGLTGSKDSLAVAAGSKAAVVLMHMQGEPGGMQNDPVYEDAALDVFDWLEARVATCLAAGISLERLAADPGVGFGKTVAHNADLLRHTALYHGLGCAVLYGVSRKTFIGKLSAGEPPTARLPGSLAAGLEALNQGAQILRVHDAAETAQARAVWEAMR